MANLRSGNGFGPDQAYFFGLEGPLDDAPGVGQVRTANLRGFSDFIHSRKGDPGRILARFGLESRALADPEGRMSCEQFVDILEYCSSLFDDSLFGLHFAESQDVDIYGPVTALCRAAPNLREALHCFVDMLPIAHSPDANMELVEGDQTIELRWKVRSDLAANDQANFQALVINLKLLRLLAGPEFRPEHIHLAIQIRSRDLPEVERIVGQPVVATAEVNAIGFSARLLDRPIKSADRLTYRLLGGYLGRLKMLKRANTVERVKSYILGALPGGSCSIERCAEQMRLSVRTLQVRLGRHSVRFADLVEAERERLARIYLTQTRMPLGEVAERLGYGDQTSFGRAFKRWTGTSPQRLRTMPDVSAGNLI